ncbi:MAG: DUF664 domain-containing protein [Streptosporangiales bacterium]|nr:DUF664 domain-containing protein [Streptosporangiales bacterium]
MPYLVPPVSGERGALLRAAVHGMSEEQAATVPSASSLSPTTLIKHVVCTERRWMADGETLAGTLADYEAAAKETESIIAGVADLGQPCADPAAAHWSARWVLLHLIEETARHAGHADIIREFLDGAKAGL